MKSVYLAPVSSFFPELISCGCRILYEEIDYINEGRNADRFRSDFRKVPWVTVPAVYWDYASTKVLTLEYAPGTETAPPSLCFLHRVLTSASGCRHQGE